MKITTNRKGRYYQLHDMRYYGYYRVTLKK